MGFNEIEAFYVDDVLQDAKFIESIFPSLLKDVVRKDRPTLQVAKLPEDHAIETIDEAEIANEHISLIIYQSDSSVVATGFDCEWSYNRFTNKCGKTSLVQISLPEKTLLIRICKMKEVPENLIRLISSPRIVKIGKNVNDDICKLYRDYGITKICYSGIRILL
jgi:hypothetical protein